MSFVKNTQPNRMRKASKRVLLGETREEEAARLEKEIAAHPVTRCEPGEHRPSSSRPGWSSKPFILGPRENFAPKVLSTLLFTCLSDAVGLSVEAPRPLEKAA